MGKALRGTLHRDNCVAEASSSCPLERDAAEAGLRQGAGDPHLPDNSCQLAFEFVDQSLVIQGRRYWPRRPSPSAKLLDVVSQ